MNRPMVYDAGSISLIQLTADINIDTWDNPKTEITISGEENSEDKISILDSNGLILISEKEENKGKIKISIKVPNGIDISIEDVDGQIVVGDTEGKISVNSSYGDIQIGKVANTEINLHESSNIHVKEVNGNLTINLTGSGDIEIGNGKINLLSIKLIGSGKIDLNGEVESAGLTLHGSGSIHITKVKGYLKKIYTGSGNIFIDNR